MLGATRIFKSRRRHKNREQQQVKETQNKPKVQKQDIPAINIKHRELERELERNIAMIKLRRKEEYERKLHKMAYDFKAMGANFSINEIKTKSQKIEKKLKPIPPKKLKIPFINEKIQKVQNFSDIIVGKKSICDMRDQKRRDIMKKTGGKGLSIKIATPNQVLKNVICKRSK